MKRNYFGAVLTLFALVFIIFGASGAANAQLQYRKALDYDGDGKADLTVIRNTQNPGTYTWYTRKSSNGAQQTGLWGRYSNTGFDYDDYTVNGDYDGDGKADYAVARRPNNINGGTLTWYIRNSQSGNVSYDTFGVIGTSIYGANQGDIPLAADYDGDGKTDVAVVRLNGLSNTTPATSFTWYWRSSQTGQVNARTVSVNYSNVCYPRHGDFDGDGKADFAQYCVGSPTNGRIIWDIVNSSNGARRQVQWGLDGDGTLFHPADFDGDGKTDFLAVRAVPNGNNNYYIWYILRSSDQAVVAKQFGGDFNSFTTGDYQLPADYDGDGKADIAVARFTPSSSSAPINWYILQSSNDAVQSITWGASTDSPIF